MGDLSNILMRLSTGLRINSGKDDPAGLIASELLKSDITATSKAITNAQRANSVISIADSSLGQVSSLLTDIKALIVEAANSGAMNAEQIKANQLQVDASLDSIDRISKTTNYQGQLLLDGSMDFQTQGLSNAAVKDLKVHQANFGTLSQVDVGINIQSNADYGKLYYDKGGISTESVIEIGGNLGSDVFRFQAGTSVTDIAAQVNKVSDSTGVKAVVGADATNGQILITSAGFDNDINLRALTAGAAAGNYTIKYTAGNSNETTYKITEPSAGQPGIIDFQLKMQPKAAPAHSALDESFNGIYTYDITGNSTGAGIVVQTTGTVIRQTEFVQYTGTPPAGSPLVSATFDKASGNLQIHYAAGATNADVERAVNSIKGFKLLSGGAAELVTQTGAKSPADLRANNALDFTATVNGTKFENTDIVYYNGTSTGNDVDLEYKAYAQQAAATIRWGGAAAAAGDVQLRISGKEASSSLNDVTIEFEQDNTFDAGDVSAVYDAERKILHIRGQIDNTDTTKNASYGTLKAAIEKASPFRADITEYNTATQKYDIAHELSKKVDTGLVTGTGLAAGSATTSNVVDNSYIKTGQVYGDIGTDHQALFIRVKDATITANDVVAAFNDPANAAISANFSVMPSIDNNGTGTIFSASWDTNVTTRVFSKALTGGKNGYVTDVTAKELTEFINNDAVLSKMFAADVALGQYGSGYLTLFDEAAYYGDPNAETSLQFLGPQGSPDVMFVTDGPSSPLYITFEPRLTSDMPAGLLATNPNAAFTVSALKAGEEYNNMAVRLIRLDNNHSKDDSYIQYKAGPSNAMAYCSIVESGSATSTETGKFIVYGKDGGTALNNVSVVAKLDKNQAERVKAVYDENTKQLIVTVNSDASSGADAITLTEAVAAINDFTPFKAEYDYSFNQETGNTGPGSANFSSVFASGPTIEIGNTGNTGGYNGILEVYVGGDDDEITAQNVIDAINNDEIYRNLFAAQTLGAGAGAGTGLINFRSDNLRKSPNEYGQSVAEMNMVTGLQGQSYDDPGYMVVHLATDQYGSSITTAADLVNFMNSLTAEETKGISVSLVRPAGLDNLLRTWTIDSCGNVIETQACEDGYGKGLLQPTLEIDDCGVVTNYPIEFFSYGENLVPGKAYGSIVAVNGINASLRIAAKNAGSEFNAVGFRYVLLTDPDERTYRLSLV
ncbi:hypothetical protein FACS189427_11520 [Planctomycetales bacterium]|nr:hypothetical protein FACS189427_11520 [Planctomycetales bacterium]